jgi:hypothetical protein
VKKPHTRTARGKIVRIELRNGEVFFDRYLEQTPGKVLILEKRGRIPSGHIKAMSDRRLLQPISSHRKG